jgi:hypothetical protein
MRFSEAAARQRASDCNALHCTYRYAARRHALVRADVPRYTCVRKMGSRERCGITIEDCNEYGITRVRWFARDDEPSWESQINQNRLIPARDEATPIITEGGNDHV